MSGVFFSQSQSCGVTATSYEVPKTGVHEEGRAGLTRGWLAALVSMKDFLTCSCVQSACVYSRFLSSFWFLRGARRLASLGLT